MEEMEYIPYSSKKTWQRSNQQLQTSLFTANSCKNIWRTSILFFAWKSWKRPTSISSSIWFLSSSIWCSWVDQLLSIAHKTCAAFDAYQTLESRGFFYISKAFDKVWHEGFIFKLKSMGISNALLDLIERFFENRFQGVVLSGQTSEWLPAQVGVSDLF